MTNYDVTIIGCGSVGAATAYTLAQYQCRILILEAENDVAMSTTRANSGILHVGYDAKPGTLVARLNPLGWKLAKEICEKLHVPRKECGSLVLALAPEELDHIRLLYDYGKTNGVDDIHLLSREETLAMEPHLSDAVEGALYAPGTAIIHPWEYALAMAEVAVKNGAEFRGNSPVTSVKLAKDGWELTTPQGTITSRYVVNAAGLGAKALHDMVAEPCFQNAPSRGEYYLLDKSEGDLVSHVIFQCPSAAGKGVLVSPTVAGNCIVGPNATPVETGNNATSYEGLAYVERVARRSVPSVNLQANIRNFAGVRSNSDQSDFIIQESAPGWIDLAGTKSPALSCAPAIGLECLHLLQKSGFHFPGNTSFDNSRQVLRFADLSPEEKNAYIAQNPAYGRVICRCETVTEGEIIDTLHSPIPPVSVDGVKRRTRAGMGRCQGSCCSPRILEIMVQELNLDPLRIPKDYQDGNILLRPLIWEGEQEK